MKKPVRIISVIDKILTYTYEGKTRIRKLLDKEVKKYLIAIKWRRAWRCPSCFLRQSPVVTGCGCGGNTHPPSYCVGCGMPTAKALNG